MIMKMEIKIKLKWMFEMKKNKYEIKSKMHRMKKMKIET